MGVKNMTKSKFSEGEINCKSKLNGILWGLKGRQIIGGAVDHQNIK
jgi:hypothetical protein